MQYLFGISKLTVSLIPLRDIFLSTLYGEVFLNLYLTESARMNSEFRKKLLGHNKEIQQNWTRAENFNNYCVIFGCYDQSFSSARILGTSLYLQLILTFPNILYIHIILSALKRSTTRVAPRNNKYEVLLCLWLIEPVLKS